MWRVRMLTPVLLGAALAGCTVKVGSSGVGGSIQPGDPNVIYFQPPEEERRMKEQAERLANGFQPAASPTPADQPPASD